MLIGHLIWTLYSLHGRWAVREDVRTAYHERVYQLAGYLDETVTDTNTVVCVPQLPGITPVWLSAPDQTVTHLALMMDNPDERRIRYADCGTGMVFTQGGDHQQVILLESDTVNTIAPYIQNWISMGDLIMEGVPENSVISMIVNEELGDTIGRFTTTAPVGYAPESPGGVGAALLPVNFTGNLTFLGYDKQDGREYAPGDIITVITYWRVDARLPENLTLFTHVLFDAQTPVAQTDTLSVMAERLRGRDVFVQLTFVPVPDDLPSGEYQTSIGAYRIDSQQRLNVLVNNQPRGNRLFLSEILVEN